MCAQFQSMVQLAEPQLPRRSSKSSVAASRCRCGMTLLEVLTASALFALLLGGMTSSVFLARMTAYEAGDDSTSASDVSGALFWMSQDIGEAVSIEQASEDRLAITVPDRDGDGA